MVSEYFTGRDLLKAVIVILDVRRDVSPLDLKLYEMLTELGLPSITVLTKVDKVTQSESAIRKK